MTKTNMSSFVNSNLSEKQGWKKLITKIIKMDESFRFDLLMVGKK